MRHRQLIRLHQRISGTCSASAARRDRWAGTIHDDREMRVALHTRASLVQEVIDRTLQAHPYEVPCIFAIPIKAGNPAYIQWVIGETAEPSI